MSPCARPPLTIVQRAWCCSDGDLLDLRVLRSGGLPAPGRWRAAGRRAGMTKTPPNIQPRGTVAAGGLQERARGRAAAARPAARACGGQQHHFTVKMGGRTVALAACTVDTVYPDTVLPVRVLAQLQYKYRVRESVGLLSPLNC